MRLLKPLVFWPPFALLLLAVIASLVDGKWFLAAATRANAFVLDWFGGLFVFGAFAITVAALVLYFAPIGRVRLGGPDARPLLTPWTWIAVSICTNTAVGILFWATAEPIYHLTAPPASLSLTPGSAEAGRFALSTLFMHWSFVPCAIYAVPAVMFALAFYNMRTPFCLGASLEPLVGRHMRGRFGEIVDMVCLYALTAGMAASLGTGVLTLAGGLEHLYGIKSSPLIWGLGAAAIVATFVASAATGLQRGISFLSRINSWVFLFLAAFVIVMGPTRFIGSLGLDALGEYVRTFLPRSLTTGFAKSDPWPKDWTIFYRANWFAWAPVTAVFLGRAGRGYTVRAFLLVNLVAPALFAIGWMTIFGATSIHMETIQHLGLQGVLKTRGPEGLAYHIFAQLPWAAIVIPMFLFTVFISYVSGADANTTAMAGLSCKGLSTDDAEPPASLKVLWGVVVGAMAVVMVTAAGIDGVRMMSNLGGLPALLFELAVVMTVVKVAFVPRCYERLSGEEIVEKAAA